MSRIPAAAIVALVLSLWLGMAEDPRHPVVPVALALTGWGLFVAWAVLGEPPSRADRVRTTRDLLRLLALAVMVRAPLFTWPPTLSDDVYRYVWEGRVWLAGYSPFTHAPNDPALLFLRDEAWSHVNHPEVSSIYPPLAQALFVVLSGFGVSGFKLAMAAADCATAALLWHRDPRAGWLWALLPLPALESAANGHLEAAGTLLVVLALGGSDLAAWLGAMLKLLPGVLLLRSRPRTWLLYGALSVAAFAPLLHSGLSRGFATYEANWSFNAGVYTVLAWVLDDGLLARRLLLVLGAGIVAIALFSVRDRARLALWTFGTFVVLSPTVHPWYVLWPLVVAVWLGVRAWVWFAALVPLAYLVLASVGPSGGWHESAWVRLVEWVPFAVLLVREGWARWSRPGPG